MSRQRSRTVTIAGIPFDSEHEAGRYMYLLACEQDGTIADLAARGTDLKATLTPRTVLPANALRPYERVLSRVTYTPDFRYTVNGVTVVEDVKAAYGNTRANRKRGRAGKPIIKGGQRRVARQLQAAHPAWVFRYVTEATAPPGVYEHRAYFYLHR